MIRCLNLFLVGLLLLATGCGEHPVVNTPSDAGVASWEVLEDQLYAVMPEVIPAGKELHDYTFDVSPMRSIRDHGTIDLWLEMCSQGDLPMVATGGYLCVERAEPSRRFEAALTVIGNSDRVTSLSFYFPAIDFLAEQLELNDANYETLTRFVNSGSAFDERKELALFMIPSEFILAWIESEDIASTPTMAQVYAVDTAIVASIDQKIELSETVKSLLESFRGAKDQRIAIWLRQASSDTDPDEVRDAVVFVLKADDFDYGTYHVALANHVDVIRNEIDLDALTLTAEQRKRVDRLLAE